MRWTRKVVKKGAAFAAPDAEMAAHLAALGVKAGLGFGWKLLFFFAIPIVIAILAWLGYGELAIKLQSSVPSRT
jgi:hypothetical protein